MRAAFTKMHGLGNDFVVLDARAADLPVITTGFARAITDRRTGIGCDQLIVLEPSDTADLRMRIFNPDGGEVGACGNATRAVALLHGSAVQIETGGGILNARPGDGGATVDMGQPRFDWDAIPLAYPMDTLAMPVGWEALDNPTAVNVGNPHAVFFIPDCDAVDLAQIGPVIEQDPLFPERVNVNVATVTDRDHIRLRVWERGAGITRACGTGACATAVAAMRRNLTDREVTVTLPGGDLQIVWGEDNRIRMTGPATEAYRGSFEWDDFA
ncbi:diaminopimelate epimerase [Qipengyuania marisflavi]|uniref:Diaminopimelate epimerase n=1 Tax=Qipengyuania marisflavi TaxID=2486356 RepID=A0A5S3P9I7_9SPHN|nr:diaminopimelate epimerase [Qipengyuania marisflavi]TMM49124.1 diaminopimelate epimerase [Qipengyuania marisflavi]